jgi:hypothetical protein
LFIGAIIGNGYASGALNAALANGVPSSYSMSLQQPIMQLQLQQPQQQLQQQPSSTIGIMAAGQPLASPLLVNMATRVDVPLGSSLSPDQLQQMSWWQSQVTNNIPSLTSTNTNANSGLNDINTMQSIDQLMAYPELHAQYMSGIPSVPSTAGTSYMSGIPSQQAASSSSVPLYDPSRVMASVQSAMSSFNSAAMTAPSQVGPSSFASMPSSSSMGTFSTSIPMSAAETAPVVSQSSFRAPVDMNVNNANNVPNAYIMGDEFAGVDNGQLQSQQQQQQQGVDASTTSGCPSLSDNPQVISQGGASYAISFSPTVQGHPLTTLQSVQLEGDIQGNALSSPMTMSPDGSTWNSLVNINAGTSISFLAIFSIITIKMYGLPFFLC